VESGERSAAPRRVAIDFTQLVDAFDSGSEEVAVYLDLETGEVAWVTSEVRRELEAIAEELPEDLLDDDDREGAIAEAVVERDLPDWMVDPLAEADRVDRGFGTRFICVPQPEARDGYDDMEAFISTVRNQRLQDRLWVATRGRGAFRRFKDLLADHPIERERWFTFKNARVLERVREWLADEGIEPTREPG
jgi:hypothetical protein